MGSKHYGHPSEITDRSICTTKSQFGGHNVMIPLNLWCERKWVPRVGKAALGRLCLSLFPCFVRCISLPPLLPLYSTHFILQCTFSVKRQHYPTLEETIKQRMSLTAQSVQSACFSSKTVVVFLLLLWLQPCLNKAALHFPPISTASLPALYSSSCCFYEWRCAGYRSCTPTTRTDWDLQICRFPSRTV